MIINNIKQKSTLFLDLADSSDKELESKRFYGYKFYICRFNFTRYNCSDSNLLEWSTSPKICIFAISNLPNNNNKIYRISGFNDEDIYELVIRGWYLEKSLKRKKRFLKEFYIEEVNMDLFYEIYKSKKNFVNKMKRKGW